MCENVFNKKWVTIWRACDRHGVHAEIHIGKECLPLVGRIYEHFKSVAMSRLSKTGLTVRGLSDDWYDKSYKTRVICVYPRAGADFDKWYKNLEKEIILTLQDMIISNVVSY